MSWEINGHAHACILLTEAISTSSPDAMASHTGHRERKLSLSRPESGTATNYQYNTGVGFVNDILCLFQFARQKPAHANLLSGFSKFQENAREPPESVSGNTLTPISQVNAIFDALE